MSVVFQQGDAIRVTPDCRSSALIGATGHVLEIGRQVEIRLADGVRKVNRNELELIDPSAQDGVPKIMSSTSELELQLHTDEAEIQKQLQRTVRDPAAGSGESGANRRVVSAPLGKPRGGVRAPRSNPNGAAPTNRSASSARNSAPRAAAAPGAAAAPRPPPPPRAAPAERTPATVSLDDLTHVQTQLIEQWSQAKREKAFDIADRIRSALRAQGVEPEDVVKERYELGLLARSGISAAAPEREPVARSARAVPVVDESKRKAQAALALKWSEARQERDYETADRIRSELRAQGVEAEDLAFQIQIGEIDLSSSATGPSAATPSYKDDRNAPQDPLGYVDMTGMARLRAEGIMKPTENVLLHKDGGTGGLLTLSYQTIDDLPPDIGFKVVSQKWAAPVQPLIDLKKMRDEEEQKRRAPQAPFRNPLFATAPTGTETWPEPLR